MKILLTAVCGLMIVVACKTKTEPAPGARKEGYDMKTLLNQFVWTDIKVSMDHLSAKEKEMVKLLVKAGQYADEIFWKQTARDAIAVREELKKKNDPDSRDILRYVMISYGPYDRFTEKRFYGQGPEERPKAGTFYPEDMTKEEFEKYIKDYPNEEKALTDLYTVVVRDGKKLKAVPYHEYYKTEIGAMSDLLLKAADLADNTSLKKYLTLRAKALQTGDYLESDVAWVQLKDHNVDVVIGPIENYEDGLFNYKAAFEAMVMVKDPEGTKELQTFKSHINALEQNLPQKKTYIRPKVEADNVLEIVNVVYFGGDCQSGVKTIAASLPNDPRVTDSLGSKKQMFKNLMEAKFNRIVLPITEKLIAKEYVKYADPHSFTTFVTLHEVSHTLGRSYVYGNDKLEVRKAMKELHSAIEETKADILSVYNMEYFKRQKMYDDEAMKKHYVTYLAGLFRSIRFGAEEAHGKANIAQMVFLKEQGALGRNAEGLWTVNFEKFHPAVTLLAKTILEFQSEGNYEGAKAFLEKYGKLTDDVKNDIDKLKDIPRDIDTHYDIIKEL